MVAFFIAIIMKKPTKKELKEYEAALKEAAKLEVSLAKYREENRIEFFTTDPNPGPNPKQSQVLEAFLDPQFKTFNPSWHIGYSWQIFVGWNVFNALIPAQLSTQSKVHRSRLA